MGDKKDKDNIKGIGKTQKTSSVSKVDGVEEVQKVEKAGAVTRSAGVAKTSGGSQALRYQDREKLFGMVEEEALNLFRNSKLPEEQKRLIREAVKMAIDSALIEEDGETEEHSDKD